MIAFGIQAEAGVNYGLIHHYFGGKEAVLREGFNRLAESYGAGPEDGSCAPTDPFSMRQRSDFVRALAFASLSGGVYDAHVVHPTIDAALERARRGRPADEDAACPSEVAGGPLKALANCNGITFVVGSGNVPVYHCTPMLFHLAPRSVC